MVLAFAAIAVLTGTLLAATVSQWFLVMPAFVGVNLLQAQLTGFCPLAKLLAVAGCERGSLFR